MVEPIRVLVGVDSAFELASGVIALLVAVYAFRAYGVARDRSMLLLHTAFLLLGGGLVIKGVAAAYFIYAIRGEYAIVYGSLILLVSTWIQIASSLLAYLILAFTYVEKSWRMVAVGQIALLLELGPLFTVFDLFSVFLLLFICVNIAASYVAARDGNKVLVLLSFSFILGSHLAHLSGAVVKPLLVLESPLRLLGFLLLLYVLIRIRGTPLPPPPQEPRSLQG